MHDAAYKDLFSHRPMVEDLLRRFAARGWSDKLDFETLEKLPADYVSDDLRQRHGDSVWRLRLQGQGEAWLYLLVMLEFQSTTDRFMAVRVLVYTGLPYQDLIRRGRWTRRVGCRRCCRWCCTTGRSVGPRRSRWGASSRRRGRRWRAISPRSAGVRDGSHAALGHAARMTRNSRSRSWWTRRADRTGQHI